jgi:hypothetical protein
MGFQRKVARRAWMAAGSGFSWREWNSPFAYPLQSYVPFVPWNRPVVPQPPTLWQRFKQWAKRTWVGSLTT